MPTTTQKPSAAELRAQKEARVADEQAQLAEARDQVAREEAAEAAAASNDHASGNGRGPQVDAQDGLFDQVIENSELEEALESREKVKASRAALNAKFKEADEHAKGIIATLELEEDVTIRVGRFRITRTSVEGRSVSFETDPTERLTISPAD